MTQNTKEEKKNVTVKGVTFTELLQLAFIVLKLTGLIDWSWKWVLAPTWIPICIAAGLFVIVILFMGLAKLSEIGNSKRYH